MIQNLIHQPLRPRPIDHQIKQRSTLRHTQNPHTDFTLHQRKHTVRRYRQRNQNNQQHLAPEIHEKNIRLQMHEGLAWQCPERDSRHQEGLVKLGSEQCGVGEEVQGRHDPGAGEACAEEEAVEGEVKEE